MLKSSNAFLAVSLLLALTSPSFAESTVTGRVSVIDGDTLDIQGQ
jgi:hypothetical protein